MLVQDASYSLKLVVKRLIPMSVWMVSHSDELRNSTRTRS